MGNFKQIEIELNRLAVQAFVFEAICFIVAMVILYFVIRYAIRDGINDSRLTDNWQGRVTAARRTTHDGDTLPPMHAD